MGNGHMEWFNTSKDIGVIFTLTCFLVILITNVVMRGWRRWWSSWASSWWWCGALLQLVGSAGDWFNLISIHMNMDFYVCFSTLIFIMWFVTGFIHDRV